MVVIVPILVAFCCIYVFIHFWSQVKWNIVSSFFMIKTFFSIDQTIAIWCWMLVVLIVLFSTFFTFRFFFCVCVFIPSSVFFCCFVHCLCRCWWIDLAFFHTYSVAIKSCNFFHSSDFPFQCLFHHRTGVAGNKKQNSRWNAKANTLAIVCRYSFSSNC